MTSVLMTADTDASCDVIWNLRIPCRAQRVLNDEVKSRKLRRRPTLFMRSPKNTYRRFMEFEEQAADIYLRLASRFCPENPELASLWLDMGMQEKQHAGLLQFCLAERLFVPDLPTEAQIRRVRGLFTSLSKRAADPELTVQGAFRIAVEMEASEINLIYSRLTTPLHRSMYLLRRKILTSMPNHLERLRSAGKKFGVPERTLRKLERLVSAPA